jgi:hypothetical protein
MLNRVSVRTALQGPYGSAAVLSGAARLPQLKCTSKRRRVRINLYSRCCVFRSMQKSSQHFPSGTIVVMKRDDGTDSTLLRSRATNSRAADAFTTPRLVLTSADRITFLNAVQGTRPFPTSLPVRIASPVSLAAEDTSFAHVRTSSGVQGYVQTKYLVSAAPPQASPKPASAPSSNFCNRVLAVDRELSSFVPIVGLDKASDMTIDAALMHARRGCSKLQGCLSDSDIHVRAHYLLPLTFICGRA